MPDYSSQILGDMRKNRKRDTNAASRVQSLNPTFFGDSVGYARLDPENNPAYQEAIKRPRGRGLIMVDSPNGGSMGVSAGQLEKYLNKGYTLSQPKLTPAQQNLQRFDQAAAYRTGYGAPASSIQPSVSGPVLAQGGVANPIENLSPIQRGQYGVGGFLDSLRSSPLSLALANTFSAPIANAASRVSGAIGNFFGGGTPNLIPSANAGAPSPTPMQTPSPSPTVYPTPSPTVAPEMFPQTNAFQQFQPPRRYSDYY